MNELIVISGCSGGGKSSLLSALGDYSYPTMSEVGRQIVKERSEVKGNIIHWNFMLAMVIRL